MRLLPLVAALLLAGCPSEEPEPVPQECPLGDLAAPAEIEVLCQDDQGQVTRVQSPMTEIPLVPPIQGGQILLLGVRARNLDGCAVMMTTSLRDPCTNEILSLERRPITLLDTGDGWGEPDVASPSSWANLAVCPNAAAGRDLQGQAYNLKITLEDVNGKTADITMPIVPTCRPSEEGGDSCLCQCQGDYNLGDVCPTGLVPGTPTECPAP